MTEDLVYGSEEYKSFNANKYKGVDWYNTYYTNLNKETKIICNDGNIKDNEIIHKYYIVYMIRPKNYTTDCKVVYYGSTRQHIDTRYGSHKTDIKKKSCSSYKVFEMFGVENCECVILHKFDNRDKMLIKEKEYISGYDCVNILSKNYLQQQIDINNKEKEYIELSIERDNKLSNMTEDQRIIVLKQEAKEAKQKAKKEAKRKAKKEAKKLCSIMYKTIN